MLLDSEGIDSAYNEGFADHQIFTLTILLASVLIFNTQNVPKRHDLEKLEYPFNKRHINKDLTDFLKGWSQ